MRVVVAAECVPQPWANGGGTTRALAIAPAGARVPAPAFDWRLSLADIDRDGPFSPLPGVDRVFALVEGALRLRFDGAAAVAAGADARETGRELVGPVAGGGPVGAVRLDAGADPLAFDGARAPHARPAAGTRTRALNLMLARGRCDGAMRRVRLAAGAALDAGWSRGATVRACYVVEGRLAVGGTTVDAGALVELHAGDPAPVATGSAGLLEVAIRAVAGAGPQPLSRTPR